MRLRLSFLLCLVPLLALHAQFADGDSRHQVRISTGIAFDDGLVYTTRAPTLGIGYEYKLSKRFGLAANVFSFYRAFGGADQVIGRGGFAADVMLEGFSGPFVTQQDLQQIKEVGIKKVTPRLLKMLSVPIDFGVNFYPISTKRHKLGMNLALAVVYESNIHPSDQWPVIIELNNGAVQRGFFRSLHKESRGFLMGTGMRLFYDYHFEKSAIGLRLGNYNFLEFADFISNGMPIWENSICFTIKI